MQSTLDIDISIPAQVVVDQTSPRRYNVFLPRESSALSSDGVEKLVLLAQIRRYLNAEESPHSGIDSRTVAPHVQDEGKLFLERIAVLCFSKSRQAMSEVYSKLNSLLLHQQFSECRAILRGVDVNGLPYNVMLAFLTFTFAARGNLSPERGELLSRIRDRIERERGQDAANEMLKTL